MEATVVLGSQKGSVRFLTPPKKLGKPIGVFEVAVQVKKKNHNDRAEIHEQSRTMAVVKLLLHSQEL